MNNGNNALKQRYVLHEVLGQNNICTTYTATDNHNGMQVVIKCFSLHMADKSKSIELFKREAKILANLHNPGIPEFIDFFQVEEEKDIVLYLVQKKIQGNTLAELVRQGKHFSEHEVIRVAVEILKILEYMHRLSPPLIHRDIKPSNIILDSENKVHLIDFGSVKDDMLHIDTMQPTIVGTYGYMPPEQFAGNASPASDIYSMGVTLIYLLSHKEPAEMKQNKTKGALKLHYAPYVRISKSLSEIFDRMIDPQLKRRYRSAEKVRKDFETLLSGSSCYPELKKVGTGAVVVILLAVAGIYFSWSYHKRKPAPVQITSDAVPSEYKVTTGTDWQFLGNAAWSARNGQGTVVRPDGRVWVMGGHGQDVSLNDVWCSDDGKTWTQVAEHAPWTARKPKVVCTSDGVIWIIGGRDDNTYFSDVWRSDDGKEWQLVTDHAPWGARQAYGVCVGPDGTLWLMGGTVGDDNARNDVWKSIDGRNWIQVSSSAAWSPRHELGALATPDGRIWVMGGIQGKFGLLNDVWSSRDGVSWTMCTAAAAWKPRCAFAMTVTPDGTMWLTAGNYGSRDNYNDCWWSRDGRNWQAAITQAPWKMLDYHSMVALPTGGLMILGGMTTPAIIRTNEVWRSSR